MNYIAAFSKTVGYPKNSFVSKWINAVKNKTSKTSLLKMMTVTSFIQLNNCCIESNELDAAQILP